MSPSDFFKMKTHIAALILANCFGNAALASRDDIASICNSAAAFVARESGVPIDVLRAISLTETGRNSGGEFSPWPWTVNMEGVGKWFDDLSDAQTYVDRHFRRGARSFDVGCFQINYKWHGHAFASIDAMFDPITNARYAAKFLGELYAEFGDWSKAAGAYHSRTPKYAKRYIARFDRIRARLPEVVLSEVPVEVAVDPEPPTETPRQNPYPFLVASRPTAGASLVPLNARGVSPLSADNRRSVLEFRE